MAKEIKAKNDDEKFLSKVKIGEQIYKVKDAAATAGLAAEIIRATGAEGELSTAITNEVTRATGVEQGLDTRVSNLEARGRFLANWNAGTGLPTTYPEVPSGATYPYTYTFKSGDYYIVGSVPTSGDVKMPDGSSIVKESATSAWTVGSKTTTDKVSVGDQFIYDGSKWTHIAAAKDVAWGNITGTLADQTDLQTALDARLDAETTVAGVAFGTDHAITATELSAEDALDLKALAHKASATGTVDGQTITGVTASYTPAGTIAVNDLTQTATAATISTKADYTPAGSITGSAISGGSIEVTVKDATSATSVTDLTFEDYTPTGSIAATTGGSFSALKSATFGEDSTNGVQIEGTVSKPAITVNDDTVDTFVKSLKDGTVDAASFTEGAFTPASISTGFFSAGSLPTKAADTFNGGSLGAATTSSFATEGMKVAMDTTDTEMLVFSTASTSSAVTAQGTFTPATYTEGTFTQGTLPSIDTTKFDGGSKAADTFSANKLPVVDGTASAVTAVTAELAEAPAFTGKKYKVATTDDTALKEVAFTGTAAAIKLSDAKYLKQEINTATFSGTAATLGFSGTKAAELIPTGITYDKATANGATFTGTAGTANVGTITVQSKSVTVE